MSDNVQSLFLEAETDFGLSLLAQQPLGSEALVFSPLSIALALALIHAGAVGETKSQIANAIAKGASDEQLTQHYSFLSDALLNNSNNDDAQADVANRLFARNGLRIKEDYLESVSKSYKASAISADFSDADATAKLINDFVNETTHGKISEIIESSAIKDDLVAVLINALYFKAKWQDKFKSSSTHEREFHRGDNDSRTENFMRKGNVHKNYASDDDWAVLSLPYKDASFAFNVFLPKQRFALAENLKKFTAGKMQTLLANMTNTFVSVTLPKFKVSTTLGLREALEKMGVKQAFTSDADFTGIADGGLSVSKVTHKALIEVDEEGTTAAAVTSIEMVLKSMPFFEEQPIVFDADHPFLFVLTKDRHPLFVGIYQ